MAIDDSVFFSLLCNRFSIYPSVWRLNEPRSKLCVGTDQANNDKWREYFVCDCCLLGCKSIRLCAPNAKSLSAVHLFSDDRLRIIPSNFVPLCC